LSDLSGLVVQVHMHLHGPDPAPAWWLLVAELARCCDSSSLAGVQQSPRTYVQARLWCQSGGRLTCMFAMASAIMLGLWWVAV